MGGPRDTVIVRFGAFEVDTRVGELRKSGVKLKLQDQPFRVLALLLEHPGEVVTREELKQTLWPDDTFVDFDNSLNTAVNKLREVLNDSASSPRFVETVPRRGYRFLAPVETSAGDGSLADSQASTAPFPQRILALQVAVITMSALLVLAVVGLIAALLGRHADPPPPPFRQFTLNTEEVPDSPVISPNGRHIAYVTSAGPQAKLWVQDLDESGPREIPGAKGASRPFWSPESRYIGFGMDRELRRVAVSGGNPMTVCRLPTTRQYLGGAWSPDGKNLVFGVVPHLYQVAAAGGEPSIVIEGSDEIEHLEQPTFAQLLRLESVLVYIFREQGAKGHGIAAASLSSGERRVLFPSDSSLSQRQFPAVSASGHLLYSAWTSAYGRIEVAKLSTHGLNLASEPQPVFGPGFYLSVSDEGTLAYLEDPLPSAELVWLDRSGRKLHRLNNIPGGFFEKFSLSPTARYVLVAPPTRVPTVHNLTDTLHRPLILKRKEGTHVGYWCWSPTEEEIAFSSYRQGSFDIFVVPVDGSAPERAVLSTRSNEHPLQWSKDGRFLLYSVSGEDIGYLERDGHDWRAVPLVETTAQEPYGALSPDSRFLAYTSNQTGKQEIYVRPFPEGGPGQQVSQNGGTRAQWSPDGKELFYVEGDTLIALSVASWPALSVLSRNRLFTHPELSSASGQLGYEVAPDGRFLVAEPAGDAPKPRIRVIQNWMAALSDPVD